MLRAVVSHLPVGERREEPAHAGHRLEPRAQRTSLATVPIEEHAHEAPTRRGTAFVVGAHTLVARDGERGARLFEEASVAYQREPASACVRGLVGRERNETEERPVAAESARAAEGFELVRASVVHPPKRSRRRPLPSRAIRARRIAVDTAPGQRGISPTMRATNRLATERSPYLRQHQHNPVDWMPWGDEAFERARREDRPVFLSVGYSACHWCHVMAHESFDDEATAALLNAHFVSIKLDREERPDIDQVFQLAHQVLTQRGGGWPLSMFLTPDRKPFFGGTYFPREPRYGMPSFQDVLRALHDAWTTRRDEVLEQANELTLAVAEAVATPRAKSPVEPRGVLFEAVKRALPRVDLERGGLSGAPKFPNTMTFDLFVAAASLDRGDTGLAARRAVAVTLDHIARGGIADHLGGGFARYSTDAAWHVPHFEKMLYDNAQLARLYVDGARLFDDGDAITPTRCRAVVERTFAWALREMTADDGTFYSAQDADSEGVEGRFFVWTWDALGALLGDDADAVRAWFGVTREGNWEHGQNVLWTPDDEASVAARVGVSVEALRGAVARAVPLLFAARETREKPGLDDKRLASWNALLIGALADAGATFGVRAWVDAAARALHRWRTHAWNGTALAHAMHGAEAYGAGFLDDHAGMAHAALDLFEATGDREAFTFAVSLGRALVTRFEDRERGGFYYTADDGEVVLHRARDPFDHAYPGGAGLAVDALARLATLTGDAHFRTSVERAVNAWSSEAAANPLGMASLVRAIDRAVRGGVEVIVMGDPSRDDTRAMLACARSVSLPHRTIVALRDADEGLALGLDPHLVEYRVAGDDGAPVAYVCRGTACEMPARSVESLGATLRRVANS